MEKELVYQLSPEKLERIRKRDSYESDSSTEALAIGSTDLYDEHGVLRLIPAPTPDPKDPLNLPQWRKIVAIAAVAFFGALALSAETIIGALVPVFALEYAGVDPKILNDIDISLLNPPGTVDLNPLKALAALGGPPLWKVSLLSSLPLLTNGLASYLLVPLSIAIGRRPVLLLCGLLAWVGGLWAGFSKGLESHIAARCVQAIGAGAVEALIPLMVQDLVFIHQRNRAMSSIWAAQGLIIVSLGIGSPAIVGTLGWRFLYYLTSGLAIAAWIGLIVAVPETRWMRSQAELSGKTVHFVHPGESRPRLDMDTYGPRDAKSNFGIFLNGTEWKAAGQSIIDTVRTMFFPAVIWGICIDSLFISMQLGAAQTGSALLIAKGWKFKLLGLAVLPIVAATPFVYLLSGYLADHVSNMLARRNGGRREPEAHLVTMIIPLICGIAGAVLFGYVGSNIIAVPSFVILISVFLVALAFLSYNTLIAVYAVESYPQWAGPVLVNISSFRCIIGFAMSFRVTDWIQESGFLKTFGAYAAVLAALSMMLPLLYIYGKPIRRWTSGTVRARDAPPRKERPVSFNSQNSF